MVQKVQGVQDGEFLVSEAPGTYSREEITVVSGQNLAAGQVLETDGTTKYQAYTAAAVPALGILWGAVDASLADAVGVMITRNAEVDSSLCADWDAGADADLPTIIDRG